MLETDSNVFVDDIIKSFMRKYGGIEKLMERNGFNFKFVAILSIRCDKVNEPKVSSYTESRKWLGYKNPTINPKMSMIDVSSMLLCPHSAIKK